MSVSAALECRCCSEASCNWLVSAEKILFAHLFEESTAHHQEALYAAAEVEKRANGRYAMDVLGICSETIGTGGRLVKALCFGSCARATKSSMPHQA